jgi:hypothetical protein
MSGSCQIDRSGGDFFDESGLEIVLQVSLGAAPLASSFTERGTQITH